MNRAAMRAATVRMREDILEMCRRLGPNAAHLGGCMSLVEIFAALYLEALRYDRRDMRSEARDRLILSKGQGSIAMYAAMRQAGILPELSAVGNLLGEGNAFYKQCVRNMDYGIEMSSGSLGQGLAYAVGVALALRRKGNETSRVYVILGDGECDEGSVWEAASLAGHFALERLVVIVDRNGLQIDGGTEEINRMDRLEERWRSFGFDACTIDGHDLDAICAALERDGSGRPRAIIARTVKGKGVSFAENRAEWHQKVLTEELYQVALAEVRGERWQDAAIRCGRD